MKLFKAILVYFAMMGIKPSQKCRKYSFNAASVVMFITLVQFCVGTAASILYDSESFKELANSFYAGSASLSAILNLITIIFNASKFFKLIEKYENTIQTSKNKYFRL